MCNVNPDHNPDDDWFLCDACDDEAGEPVMCSYGTDGCDGDLDGGHMDVCDAWGDEPYVPCVDIDGACQVCGECRHICATFDKALRDKATDDYYASERDETRDEIDALLSWDEAIDADGIIDAS